MMKRDPSTDARTIARHESAGGVINGAKLAATRTSILSQADQREAQQAERAQADQREAQQAERAQADQREATLPVVVACEFMNRKSLWVDYKRCFSFIAFILITLASISSIATASSCVADAGRIVLGSGELGPVILIIIGLTTLIIALAYMFGRAFSKAEFIVFAKDELYHLGFSIVMLLGFSGILLLSCSLMNGFIQPVFGNLGLTGTGSMNCYHNGDSMQSISMCYASAIKDTAKNTAEYYVQQHINEEMDSTWSMSLAMPGASSYVNTAAAYRKVRSNQYDMVLNTILIPALMSISIQKLAIQFISVNLLLWVLPVAFLLRIFIWTRPMGDILIALCIGLYVIVPFMYAFNFAMYEAAGPGECARLSTDNPQLFCAFNEPSADCCTDPNSFWIVAKLVPQAFFLPNLTIVVLITFFSAVHKAFRVIG